MSSYPEGLFLLAITQRLAWLTIKRGILTHKLTFCSQCSCAIRQFEGGGWIGVGRHFLLYNKTISYVRIMLTLRIFFEFYKI